MDAACVEPCFVCHSWELPPVFSVLHFFTGTFLTHSRDYIGREIREWERGDGGGEVTHSLSEKI